MFQAGFDMKYLKETYLLHPQLHYCPTVAIVAKAGWKKKLKQLNSPLKKKGNKKQKAKKKLTEMEEMEFEEDIKMGAA